MTIKIGTNKHELINAYVMVDGVKRQIIEIKVPTRSGNRSVWELKRGMTISELPIGARVKNKGSSYYGKDLVYIKLEDDHYGNNETTLLIEQIICLKAIDAKEPSNSNSKRKSYGNNRYIHSNLRQWLNSSASNWYSVQHSADAPPTSSGVSYNAYDKEKGFMANLTPELRSAILPTSLKVTKNPVDGGGLESFTDKIFIPSCTEVGLSNDTSYDEGTKFDYFKSNSDRVATTTKECVENSDYTDSGLKPDNTWNWWTRTPYFSSSYPSNVHYVYNDGSRSSKSTYHGDRGVRPACTIPKDTLVSNKPDSDGCYILMP